LARDLTLRDGYLLGRKVDVVQEAVIRNVEVIGEAAKRGAETTIRDCTIHTRAASAWPDLAADRP